MLRPFLLDASVNLGGGVIHLSLFFVRLNFILVCNSIFLFGAVASSGGYVGAQACSGCHKDIAATQSQTGVWMTIRKFALAVASVIAMAGFASHNLCPATSGGVVTELGGE